MIETETRDRLIELVLNQCLLRPTAKFLTSKYAVKQSIIRLGATEQDADKHIELFLERLADANAETERFFASQKEIKNEK